VVSSRARSSARSTISSCQRRSTALRCAGGTARQRGADRRQDDILVEWLFKKIGGADLHCFDRKGNIAMSGDHDDGNRIASIAQFPQQLETIHFRHAHVRKDASGFRSIEYSQKILGRFMSSDVDRRSAEKEGERIPNRLIVIYNVNDTAVSHPANPLQEPAAA
jgi:hypothetical protein